MEIIRCPSPATIASKLNAIIKSPIKNHTCDFRTCDIENLTVEIHKYNGQFMIRCKYINNTNINLSKDTLYKTLYSIYLCKNTGKIHYCHAQCDGGRITNNDNCNVCCVSGVQYESETVRSWQISSRCVPTVIQDKRDPNMFNRDSDGRVIKKGTHNIKVTQCILLAKEILNRLLFSRTRMQSEEHKYREKKKHAEKVVNKYRRYCDRSKRPKNYIHILTIYIHTLQKKQSFTSLICKTKEQQKDVIDKYTRLIITYWKMFLNKTVSQSNTFSFKIFAPACLYIMRKGLMMSGIFIIEKSRYLESALPEANGLHLYNINKPSLTQGQKHILKCIRETVENKVLSPKQLSDYCKEENLKLYK